MTNPATIKMSIGGQKVTAENNKTFSRADPITGEVATTAPAASPIDSQRAAEAAAAAFPAWSSILPNARRALLMQAADALEGKADAFVDAMMCETGATEGWAMFNLGLAAGMIREAAAITTRDSFRQARLPGDGAT